MKTQITLLSSTVLMIAFTGCQKEPTACFKADKTSVAVGESVKFEDCSVDAVTYEWDFDDGDDATKASPSHSFSAAGTYEVELTVYSKNGKKTSTKTKDITVTNPGSTTANAVLLIDSVYTDGNLTAGGTMWFYFNATSGIDHDIFWDDSDGGSGTYTCDLLVSAYREDALTSYFLDDDYGYTTPRTMTAVATEKVYVKVEGYDSSESGTFSVKSVSKPVAGPSNAIQLTNSSYSIGSITAGGSQWFYFNAVSGVTYDIYWDDSFEGSGPFTCDILMSGYRADGVTSYFTNVDSGFSIPTQVIASATERVYLKVEGYDSGDSGTFGVVFH